MGFGNRRAGGGSIGDIEADRVDAVAELRNEIAQLRRLTGGCGDTVTGLEGGSGEGTAEAAEEPVMNQVCSMLLVQHGSLIYATWLC